MYDVLQLFLAVINSLPQITVHRNNADEAQSEHVRNTYL
jgi:hypothetical protein